jgi:glycosyltransferase involved in cell wall biosynthesis
VNATARKIRVVHVINSFEFGGAEAMLCDLVLRHDRDRFEPRVVSLIDDLTVAGPLLDAGVPVDVMGMRSGVPDPRGVLRLARLLRRLRPDVVQTWMDHSNLIGGAAAWASGAGASVVWGVHHSNHVRGLTKRSTLLTVWACAKLSHAMPTWIVSCSEHSRRLYEADGFDADRMSVIPNGFDTDRFRPDPAARADVRRELRLDGDTPLVGLVARFDPLKDHETFLAAAAELRRACPGVRFALCGANVDAGNAALTRMIRRFGLEGCCHLLGPRRDMPRVYAALDVLASSSISEAFPLVLGEAMACGVPCVATDVGDSSLIVGRCGATVPPRDASALASACARVLALRAEERRRLGGDARARIVSRFGLDAITARYESLYARLAGGAAAPGIRTSGRAATVDAEALQEVR